MKSRLQHLLSIASVLLLTQSALGQSAIQKYGDPTEDLPSRVSFDCEFDASSEVQTVSAFGAKMRAPNRFEIVRDGANTTWLYWNVLLEGEDGETFSAPYVTMQVAAKGFNDVPAFIDEFRIVAGPETNNLSVTVFLRTPQPDDRSARYWLFLTKDDGFVKIISFDPIDWVSLLACFADHP